MIKLKPLLETINTKIERIGFNPDEERPAMPVDWDATDVQILSKWNVKTVREFAGKSKNFTAIYPAIIETCDLDPHLAEEEPEEGEEVGGYDWSEFRMHKRGFPPIVVCRTKSGHIEMMDGNHRVKYAQELGYDSIAAWVVDEFLQTIIDSRKV